MSGCRRCGVEHNNGSNFCTRKCRKAWIREHNIKGAKKRAKKMRDEGLMQMGSSFSNENDCQDSPRY